MGYLWVSATLGAVNVLETHQRKIESNGSDGEVDVLGLENKLANR